MPSTIITKNGSGAPLAADLVAGELAVDLTNGRLYTEDSGGSVIEIGLNPSGNLDVTGTVSADGLTVLSSSESSLRSADETPFQLVIGNNTASSTSTHGLRIRQLNSGAVHLDAYDGAGESLLLNALTGGSVGIGTASPASLLHLSSNAPTIQISEADVGTENYIQASGGGFNFFADDTNSVAGTKMGFYVDGTERMRIDSSGNVGIGATSPGGKLSIRATSFAGSDSHFGFGANNDIYLTYGSTGNTIVRTIDGLGANSEKMRIDSSGNVGIGETNPLVPLHVLNDTGATSLLGNVAATFRTGSASNPVNIQLSDGTNAANMGMTTGDLFFATASTERLRLSSSGDLSLNSDGSIAALDGVSGMQIGNSTASSAGLALDTLNNGYLMYVSGTSLKFWDSTDNTDRLILDGNGNLLVGSTDTNPWNNSAGSSADNAIFMGGGRIACAMFGGVPLLVNRTGGPGDLTYWYSDGSLVGYVNAISASAIAINGNNGSFASMVFGGSSLIYPSVDNVADLGANTNRFNDAYITNGVTTGSDANDKQDIETLSDAEQRVAVACKGLLRKWRWKDAVEAKGDEARIHFGIIAQDLQAAFEAEGLDAGRYAMFISNTWTDEETGEERTRLGVRYHELLAFIIAAI